MAGPIITPGYLLGVHAASARTSALEYAPGLDVPPTTLWYDKSGNGYNLALMNTAYISGSGWDGDNTIINPCQRRYDGLDDYDIHADSDAFSFTDGAGHDLPFSVAGWVYVDADKTTTFALCGKYSSVDPFTGEWTVSVTNGNSLFMQCFYSSPLDRIRKRMNGTIERGVWNHFAATYDGSKAHTGFILYANGQSVAATGSQQGVYAGMVKQSAPLTIGSYLLDSRPFKQYAKGGINSLQIYPFALTPEQIAANYAAGMVWPVSKGIKRSWFIFGM